MKVEVSNDDLRRIFGLPSGRNAPDEFSPGVSDKEYLQTVLLRPANKDQVVNVKQTHLKRKYKLLFDIVSKLILEIAFSPDALTQLKQQVMIEIIEKAQDMNCLGLFKHRLLQETDKFGINEKNEVFLTKKICNNHKVSIILVDKLPSYRWSDQGRKPYLMKFKALLWKDAEIPGQPDDDPVPYVLKSKKDKA